MENVGAEQVVVRAATTAAQRSRRTALH